MAKNNLTDWDTTAGNNTDVGGINIAEGWAPENVNNAARETMAQLAAFHGDTTGKLTTGGAANAYTLTTNDGIAVPAAGQRYAAIANHACTGASTMAVNGGAAKSLVKNHDLALEDGDIEINQIIEFFYEATDDTYQLTSHLAVVNVEGANVDIANTTAETAIDKTADSILVYDSTATANREAVISDVVGLEQDTSQATTSGSTKDFTAPSWAKRVVVLINGVSLTTNDNLLVQLGDAGGIETTGYASVSITSNTSGTGSGAGSTSGLVFHINSAGSLASGRLVIENETGNEWVSSHAGYITTSAGCSGGGRKTLSAALTTVRVTVTGGLFDAGSVNCTYE